MKELKDEFIYLSSKEVLEYLKNRPPMLMIEDAYVKPGISAFSERVLHKDEWFFECHFPENPMMPGVLQLESLFNLAALPIKMLDGNKNKTTNIVNIKNVSFKKHIYPKEKIRIEVQVNKSRRGLSFMQGKITSNDKICCEAEFILVILDDIIKI